MLNGKVPEKNRFKHKIEQAKKDRVKANQNYKLCLGKISFYPKNKTLC